jgi:hypothetical protein
MRAKDIISDPVLFCSRLTIVDKRGRPVKLKLRSEQIQIIEAMAAGDDTLILKARQIGSTTAVAAYFFWKWFTAPDAQTYVSLSHKLASAKHILDIQRRFFTSLPRALQRPLSVDNTTTMTLADTGATLMAASAEGKGGLRSFTATGLHISEFSFTPNADELKATAIAALNGGQLCIESTANHWGDPLHREIELWEAEMVEWNFLFFPWTAHEEYTQDPPDNFEIDPDLDMTPGQQYWMARMAGKLGETKFRREYPLSVDDAYAQTDGAWIPAEMLKDIQVVKLETEGGQIAKLDHNDRYAIGVDTGAGVGGDYSALVVVSAMSGSVVEVRRSNSHTPTDWAQVVADASRKWKDAKVLVESNGTWGGVIITELKHMSIPLWKDSDGDDWTTNASTKPKMLEGLKDALSRVAIPVLDSWTVGELRAFKVDDRGNPFCPRNGIHHGDTVIALALALQCVQKVSVPDKPFLPAWITARKASEARGRGALKEMRRY